MIAHGNIFVGKMYFIDYFITEGNPSWLRDERWHLFRKWRVRWSTSRLPLTKWFNASPYPVINVRHAQRTVPWDVVDWVHENMKSARHVNCNDVSVNTAYDNH